MSTKDRIVVVYNPRSSKAVRVEREVLEKLKDDGRDFDVYKVRETSVNDNAKRLANFLQHGDIVIVAGGDGTATIGLNGVALSKKKVKLAVLPYGNFNDMARMLRCKNLEQIFEFKRMRKLYPMEMLVNGKHFRYASCYFTIGMFAESTEIFDKPATRKALQKGNKSLGFSILRLVKWWRRNRRKKFLPSDLLATDILAVNGRSMARVMRGDKKLAFSKEGFLASKQRLSSWAAIGWFMFRSMIFRVPGGVAKDMKLEFDKEVKLKVQAEGECTDVKCKKIEVIKPGLAVEVITR